MNARGPGGSTGTAIPLLSAAAGRVQGGLNTPRENPNGLRGCSRIPYGCSPDTAKSPARGARSTARHSLASAGTGRSAQKPATDIIFISSSLQAASRNVGSGPENDCLALLSSRRRWSRGLSGVIVRSERARASGTLPGLRLQRGTCGAEKADLDGTCATSPCSSSVENYAS